MFARYATRFLVSLFTIGIVSLSLFLSLTPGGAMAATYVFGEDGNNQDLTGTGGPGTTWTSSDQFIIAGDAYVPSGATLTLESGVAVEFDWDYGGDNTGYPTVEVRGTLQCYGTAQSPVKFTNLGSDTTRGLFEGLLVTGAGPYEGVLDAGYTVFEFGGRTTAHIVTDDDASVTLSNCTVRLSDNDGLYIAGDDVALEMEACTISSHYGTGLNTSSDPGSTQISFEVTNCHFSAMGGSGAELGREGQYYTMRGNRHEDITAPALLLRGAIGGGESVNEIFRNAGTGILFDNSTHTGGSYYNIYNCAIYDNATDGIRISDLDYQGGQQDENLKVRIRNCNLWSNDRDGLRVEGWDPDSYQDGEGNNVWPQTFDPENPTYMLELSYNIFGDNDGTGINVTTETNDPPVIYEFNAFQNDGGTNCAISGCIQDGVDGAVVRLVSEASPFDFHFLWNGSNPTGEGINALMNVNHDANWLDVGSSDVDCGIFGGPHGNSNRNEAGTATLESYVKLGSSGTGLMPWAVYYMFADFTVAHVQIGGTPELQIRPSASILATGNYRFIVNGTLETNPLDEEGTIVFGYHGTGSGWKGIYLNGDNALDCVLREIEVRDTQSNYAGIEVRNVDAEGGNVELTNVVVEDCGTGIYLNNSRVNLTGVEVLECRYENVLTVNCPTGFVWCRNLLSHDNLGTQSLSSGVRMLGSEVNLLRNDANGLETWIDDNGKYGLHCDESTPEFDHIDITLSGTTEMLLRDVSFPVMDYTANNIMPQLNGNGVPIRKAITFVSNGQDTLKARGNHWGVADPSEFEDSLFSHPAQVDYSDWSEDYIDDFSDFFIALDLMHAGDYAGAIPYLQRAAADEDLGGHRHSALRYLRGCYANSGGAFDNLRGFLGSFAEECNDAGLRFTAETVAILSLANEGRYEDCRDGFIARREALDDIVDSLRNEKYLILAESMLDDGHEINAAGEVHSGLARLDSDISHLHSLIDEAYAMGAIRHKLVPSAFALRSIHPNPFNGKTQMTLDLPEAGRIEVAVYDLIGRRIQTLAQGLRPAGKHRLVWDAEGVAAGLYFVRAEGPGGVRVSQVALVR
ncbi:MAG: T9SS type A sorting domain-containing protein [Calditrichaeota bacterium]|nr:T9SS type A sorting domain-containing protein [Calditrichota bacterium]